MDGTRLLSLFKRPGPGRPVVAASMHRRWLKLFLCVFLLASFGFLYVYSALSAPRRSPLLVFSAPYSPSWDLNPWGNENIGLLRQMNRRNLSLVDAGDGSDIANGWWTKIDELIAANLLKRSTMPLLVYVNLHGAVDDASQPRLIPPHADAYDPRTWISVWELLQHLNELLKSESTTVVLFFESGRANERSPSIAGDCSFAQALEQLLLARASELQFKNLHVLVSSADHAPSVTDWNSGCDLFTRELASGLFGTADLLHHGGNQDGYVQFSELTDFVAQQVGQWSERHRGTRQTVWSWSQHSADTRLTWKLSGSPQPPPASTQPSGTELEQIQEAWLQISKLRERQPWQAFPSQWRALCDLALGYEQAVHGGQSARQQAANIASAFAQQFAWLQNQLTELQISRTLEQRQLAAQATAWQAWMATPTYSNAQRLSQTSDADQTSSVGCVPVLRTLAGDPSYLCWSQTASLVRYANLRREVAAIQSSNTPDVQNYCATSWEQLRSMERQIDDLLLADCDAPSLEEHIDRYEQGFDLWRKLVSEYQQLHTVRDQLIAQLPNLAECLLATQRIEAPARHTSSVATSYHRLEDQLVLLALNTSRVCEALAAPTQVKDSGELRNIAEPLQQLSRQHTQLWEQLLLRDLSPSPTDAAKLETLLNYGWLPSAEAAKLTIGKQRIQAWKRLRAWEHQLALEPSENPTGADTAGNNSAYDKPQHDFSRFFVACVTGKSRADSLPPAALRNWLRMVGNPQLSRAPDRCTPASLLHWRQVDLETRLAASVAGATDPMQNVATLRDLQATHRLLSYANETLDDFWAAPVRQTQPYFHWLASDAMAEARAIEARLGDLTDRAELDHVALLSAAANQSSNTDDRAKTPWPSTDVLAATFTQRAQQLSLMLQARKLAAQSALLARPGWLPDLDASLMQPDNQITWNAQVEIAAGKTVADLPSGTAAVCIQNTHMSQRQPLALSANLAQTRIPFTLEHRPDSNIPSEPVTASLKFRGHKFADEALGMPYSGGNVRIKYLPATSTSLTIYDKSPGGRRRTFILDCSASMIEGAVGEQGQATSTSTPATTLNKLEAAKLALLDLLQDLRGSKDHVSVILYGHRVAQGSVEQGTLLQSKYLEKYPLSQPIEAYEDVETILPMGRFGDMEAQQVQERLSGIVPWGQTPLFLAVAQALQSNPPGNQPHDVIVISDGKNYQFNPSAEKRIEVEEVIRIAQSESATVHVIGFGVPEDQLAASTTQFEQLAQGTNGTATLQIADASLLSQRLAELHTPPIYRVLTVDGSILFGRANEALTIPTPSSANEKIAIEYREKTYIVPLNPGATLRMSIDPRGQLVVSDNSDDGPTLANLIDSEGRACDWIVGLHRPQLAGKDMRWKLSIRGQDSQIIARPHRLIVELQPLAARDSVVKTFPTYILAENNWSHDSPLPTIEFTATDWPSAADRANVQVWIVEQMPVVAPHMVTPLGDLHWHPLEGFEIRMHHSPTAATAVITTPSGYDSADWLLSLTATGLQAAEHRYVPASNTSFHFFELSSAAPTEAELELGPAAPPRSAGSMELISLAALKQQALKLATPIEVDIERPLTAIAPTPSLR